MLLQAGVGLGEDVGDHRVEGDGLGSFGFDFGLLDDATKFVDEVLFLVLVPAAPIFEEAAVAIDGVFMEPSVTGSNSDNALFDVRDLSSCETFA